MVTGEIIRHGKKTLAAAEGDPDQVNSVFLVKVPSGSKG